VAESVYSWRTDKNEQADTKQPDFSKRQMSTIKLLHASRDMDFSTAFGIVSYHHHHNVTSPAPILYKAVRTTEIKQIWIRL